MLPFMDANQTRYPLLVVGTISIRYLHPLLDESGLGLQPQLWAPKGTLRLVMLEKIDTEETSEDGSQSYF